MDFVYIFMRYNITFLITSSTKTTMLYLPVLNLSNRLGYLC